MNKELTTFILLLFLCNSCFTPALWEKTDPNQYIQIKFTEITEKELKEKEIKYYKDEKTHSYYVEKKSFSKLKDY